MELVIDAIQTLNYSCLQFKNKRDPAKFIKKLRTSEPITKTLLYHITSCALTNYYTTQLLIYYINEYKDIAVPEASMRQIMSGYFDDQMPQMFICNERYKEGITINDTLYKYQLSLRHTSLIGVMGQLKYNHLYAMGNSEPESVIKVKQESYSQDETYGLEERVIKKSKMC